MDLAIEHVGGWNYVTWNQFIRANCNDSKQTHAPQRRRGCLTTQEMSQCPFASSVIISIEPWLPATRFAAFDKPS